MLKALNKLFYIVLFIILSFLLLDKVYVIQFTEKYINLLLFLTFIMILLTSSKEFFTGKSGFLKFVSSLTIILTIAGGAMAVYNSQLNILVYICILFSLIQGIIELVYAKA